MAGYKKGRKTTFTPEQKEAYFAAKTAEMDTHKHNLEVAFNALSDGLQAGHTESFKQYLKNMSKFYRYSPCNVWLLLWQNPNITLVNTYGRWQDLGYQVRKGENAMFILFPKIVNKKDTKDDGTVEKRSFLAGFGVTNSIFDISQCDPIEGKAVNVDSWFNLGDDDKGLEPVLPVVAEKFGITYEYRSVSQDRTLRGAYGYAQGKMIVLRDDLTKAQQVQVAVHEVAHHVLDHVGKQDRSKNTKELEAECTSFVVCNTLGIDTSAFSFDYLLSFDATKEALEASLGNIQKAGKEILAVLDPHEAAIQQAEATRLEDSPATGNNYKGSRGNVKKTAETATR